MTAPKRTISEGNTTMLRAAIAVHTKAAACSVGQAAELAKKEGVEFGRVGADHQSAARAIATQRAVHELEAATHAAALTTIACTLAELDARGFETSEFLAFAEAAEEAGVATGWDSGPGSPKPDAPEKGERSGE